MEVKPSILPGFVELVPQEERIFQDMIRKISRVYESFGCMPIDTPIIEKSEAFKEIGLNEYYFAISNRKLIKGLMAIWQVEEKESEVLGLMDKYYKMPKETFKLALEELIGERICEALMLLLDGKDQRKTLTLLNEYRSKNQVFDEGLKEVQEVLEELELFGMKKENYRLDLSIIRGLDYYTGTVFETFLKGMENYGSVCSGGRYEQLANCFTKENYPGVGISIGLTRLFSIVKETSFKEKYKLAPVADYAILSVGSTKKYALQVANKFRKAGYTVCLNLEDQKLKKKLNYANKLQVPKAVIIGEDEMNEQKVLIKDMQTGNQVSISIDEMIEKDND